VCKFPLSAYSGKPIAATNHRTGFGKLGENISCECKRVYRFQFFLAEAPCILISYTFWLKPLKPIFGDLKSKLWRACNLTAFIHSSAGPVVHPLLPVVRDPCSIPRGVLMWNWDSPVSVVSLHWWPWRDWSLWPLLRWTLSRTVTRPLCRQCDNPTWSHSALLSRFHARVIR
jgi:hypothetical protein